MGVKDGEAFDRKIRPIYDALDANNWKTTLKLTAAALQKYPDSDLIKSLRAIGLERSGKHAEAMKMCDEVVASCPTDEHILRTATIVLKDAQRFADITRIYEGAFEKEPHNLEIGKGLFGAYVREQNYVKQQQLAVKLNKQHGGERYLWWAILSIILQACDAPWMTSSSSNAVLDSSRLLQLAESILSRQAGKAGGQLESIEALLVYLDVLLAQGKFSTALELVTSTSGNVVTMPAERSHLHAVLCALTGDFMRTADLLEGVLLANPDDWSTLQLYFDCVLPGSTPNTHDVLRESSLLGLSGGLVQLAAQRPMAPAMHLAPDTLASALRRAQATVNTLIASVDALTESSTTTTRKLTMRGPRLAQVELAARRMALGAASSPCELANAVLDYFLHNGSMVSCAVDLRPYTVRVEGEERTWLAEQLSRWAPATTAAVPAASKAGLAGHINHMVAADASAAEPHGNGSSAMSGDAAAAPCSNATADRNADGVGEKLKRLRMCVCAAQVLDDLCLPLISSPTEGVKYAESLMHAYAAAAPLTMQLDERERGPADELPALAAASLVSGAGLAPSAPEAVIFLLQALLVLHAGVADRPFNSTMRLALAALCTLLGCPTAAHNHIRKLDIKHIQLDSLGGHQLLPALLAYGSWQHATKLLAETLSMFNDHSKDAGDTLLSAYKFGTYSKVLEFVAFKHRLENAHTRAVARCERALLAITTTAQQSPTPGSDQVAAAVRNACLALPLSELPFVSSSTNGGNSSSLRFNEDLTTRPAWYPPVPGAAHLAPAVWWENRSAHCGQGTGRQWWCIAGAAERDVHEAAELRHALCKSVVRRWLIPHLLAAASGLLLPSAMSGSSVVLSLADAVVQYAETFGIEAGGLDSALQLQSQALPAGRSPPPVSLQLELLGLHIFATAEAIQSAFLQKGSEAGNSTATASSAKAVLRLALAQEMLVSVSAELCEGLADAVAASRGIMPGHGIALAFSLLQGPLAWLALCLEVWSKTDAKTAKKSTRAVKKGGEPPVSSVAANQPQAPALQESVLAARSSLQEVAAGVCMRIAELLEPAATATHHNANGLAEQLLSGPGGTSWEWLRHSVRKPGFVSQVLLELVQEQQYVVAQLQQLARQQAAAFTACAL